MGPAIPFMAFLTFAIMILFGLGFPFLLAFFWCKKKKEPVTTVLIGAAVFIVFAVVLETVPKLFLYQIESPVKRFVMGNKWIYGLSAALLAGIFEETGRYLAFRLILKKRTWRETSISYGIGHGGIEVMYLLVLTGINNIIYAVMIATGQFDSIIEAVRAVNPDQVAALEALPEQLASVNPANVLVSMWERISAVLLHIGMSIVVFQAARDVKKRWMFPLAILLHFVFDTVAALSLVGIITNTIVLEVLIFIAAILMLFGAYFLVYRKMEKKEVD